MKKLEGAIEGIISGKYDARKSVQELRKLYFRNHLRKDPVLSFNAEISDILSKIDSPVAREVQNFIKETLDNRAAIWKMPPRTWSSEGGYEYCL